MKRKPRFRVDSLEHQIEGVLKPGAFITDGACFSFVHNLREVAGEIAKRTGREPACGVALYETFLAGCYAKAEEIDDSSGSFGQFVSEIFCGWITARQKGGAHPDETASRLIGWMDDDPYGFCYRLENDAADVFDKAGLAAFVKQIRARFDSAEKTTPKAVGTLKDRPENVRRCWSEALRTLYVAQKNVEAYIALVEETGVRPRDCCAIAALLISRRKPQEALAWVKRGIELDRKSPRGSGAGFDLARLERKLLTQLGLGKEALDAAWADFRKHPSKYSYGELMKFVPRAERTRWHMKAIGAAERADLHSHLELLLETKELDRIADLVRRTKDLDLEDLSYFITDPVAKKLDKTHPELAARLWRAQGMRIVNAGKSKYYAVALSNFESAKRCFERAGRFGEWVKTVRQVRADHRRKTGFMSAFESLVADAGSSDEPSFLERAKARWKGGQRREG